MPGFSLSMLLVSIQSVVRRRLSMCNHMKAAAEGTAVYCAFPAVDRNHCPSGVGARRVPRSPQCLRAFQLSG